MTRSFRTAGFNGHGAHFASSRLDDAVAATLALSALSLSAVVAVTLMSIRIGGLS